MKPSSLCLYSSASTLIRSTVVFDALNHFIFIIQNWWVCRKKSFYNACFSHLSSSSRHIEMMRFHVVIESTLHGRTADDWSPHHPIMIVGCVSFGRPAWLAAKITISPQDFGARWLINAKSSSLSPPTSRKVTVEVDLQSLHTIDNFCVVIIHHSVSCASFLSIDVCCEWDRAKELMTLSWRVQFIESILMFESLIIRRCSSCMTLGWVGWVSAPWVMAKNVLRNECQEWSERKKKWNKMCLVCAARGGGKWKKCFSLNFFSWMLSSLFSGGGMKWNLKNYPTKLFDLTNDFDSQQNASHRSNHAHSSGRPRKDQLIFVLLACWMDKVQLIIYFFRGGVEGWNSLWRLEGDSVESSSRPLSSVKLIFEGKKWKILRISSFLPSSAPLSAVLCVWWHFFLECDVTIRHGS